MAKTMLIMPILFLIVFLVPIVVGVFVYKDALSRGMDAILWALVAALTPSFVGLIIYMIARSDSSKTCLRCGRHIKDDFKICPYCNHSVNLRCSQCGKEVASDWKICPYCKNELDQY